MFPHVYSPIVDWSVAQCQVNDRLAFVVLSCQKVCGLAIISNFLSILVNQSFQDGGVPLHVTPKVPMTVVGVNVSRQDCSALPADTLPAQLLLWSLS